MSLTGAPSSSEEGTTSKTKDLEGFYLKAQATVWPRLSFTCRESRRC